VVCVQYHIEQQRWKSTLWLTRSDNVSELSGGEIAVRKGRIVSQENARKNLSRWLDGGQMEDL
jgi:hypothetical protein